MHHALDEGVYGMIPNARVRLVVMGLVVGWVGLVGWWLVKDKGGAIDYRGRQGWRWSVQRVMEAYHRCFSESSRRRDLDYSMLGALVVKCVLKLMRLFPEKI